jgi:autotransporter-associated beta strand protein
LVKSFPELRQQAVESQRLILGVWHDFTGRIQASLLFINFSYFLVPLPRGIAEMNLSYSRRSPGSGWAVWHIALSCRSARVLAAVCVVATIALCKWSRAATVDNWNVHSGGSWNTGANWSTGSIPTIAEDATIGSIATSVTSPASITLDATQTAYGLTLDPGPGKSIHVDPGAIANKGLNLLSTDTAPDGINKFFTINAVSGVDNQINAPIVLEGAIKGTYTAMVNSFDPTFAIKGGIMESVASWGVRVSGNNQGIVSYATASSIYTGDTTIAPGGILRVDLNNAIPNGTGKGNVVLEGNGQLQFLNATAQTINALNSTSSTAVVTNNPGNNGVTLTVGNAGVAGTFAGSINNPIGTGLFNLVKTGQGIQKLIGADSYRGTTTVSSGTLLVNGTHNSAGNYSTSSGATLGGSGTINLGGDNSVTVSTGSLAPGDGAPGVLNINGRLNMSSVGTLRLELGGAFPGNGLAFYDQINMTSPTAAINASFAHIAVSLVNGFTPQSTNAFYILTRADSAAFGTEPFDALSEGATIGLGSGLFGKVTYKANWTGSQATSTVTGGNDMAIYNVVPEPTSISLLGLAVFARLVSKARKANRARLQCEEDNVCCRR